MLRFRKKHKDPLPDPALLACYRETGEAEWLGQLYGRYLELVYGLCLKYLESEADAEDAVMNIYEELTVKVHRHEIDNFRSWLYVLAKNHCLMKLRRDRRNLTVAYEPELMQSGPVEHPTIEIELDEAAENGQVHHLRDCLQTLKDQQKQCIELFYLQGHSYQEVSEKCKLKLGTVRSHIQNGRRNLRICMEEKASKPREDRHET